MTRRNLRRRLTTVLAQNMVKKLTPLTPVTIDMLRKKILAVSREIPTLHKTRRP
jgi:septum formation topological specificity factor MinE